jgi:hypothetical protein
MNELASFRSADASPALIAAAGERAGTRFFEFFTANIRNPHTRRAYSRSLVGAAVAAWRANLRRSPLAMARLATRPSATSDAAAVVVVLPVARDRWHVRFARRPCRHRRRLRRVAGGV